MITKCKGNTYGLGLGQKEAEEGALGREDTAEVQRHLIAVGAF